MPSYVLRVWLTDRPGALGAIASNIGAAGGDVVGIDILERGEGRVIDELAIDLPREEMVPAMLASVSELEGVDVEDLRAIASGREPHPHLDALEIAAGLLSSVTRSSVFDALVAGVVRAFSAEWAALVRPDDPEVLAHSAAAPPHAWLEAFVTGTRLAARDATAAAQADDVCWTGLDRSGLALLIGRSGRPFRARERRQLATLARIADHRCGEVVDGHVPSGRA